MMIFLITVSSLQLPYARAWQDPLENGQVPLAVHNTSGKHHSFECGTY